MRRESSRSKQIPEALPVAVREVLPEEVLVALPADTGDRNGSPRAPWSHELLAPGAAVGYFIRLLFFGVAPAIALFFCYMAQHQPLNVLIVGTVLFAGVLGRAPKLTERRPWLKKVPLIGDLLEVSNRLHAFYFQNQPRSFLFYLLYPVSCPLFCLFSATARREFRLYAGVFASVTVALVVELAYTYSTIYPPHLSVGHAVGVGVSRLFLCFLIFVTFFIPVVTTSFTYQLSDRPWRMRLLVILGIVFVVPMFLLIGHEFNENPFVAKILLDERLDTQSFREELKKNTEMFLRYHSAQPLKGDHGTPAVDDELTKQYQSQVSWLAKGEEVRYFDVITLPGEASDLGRLWLGVRVRSEYPQLVGLVSPDGQFYSSWDKLPLAMQQRFQLSPDVTDKVDVIRKRELIDDFETAH